MNQKKTLRSIISVVVVIAAVLCLVSVSRIFTAQYNLKGIQKYLQVTIDRDTPKQEIGKLDGYEVSTEQLADVKLITFSADYLSLSDAIETGKISANDLLSVASDVEETGDSTNYYYEQYCISISQDQLRIRPVL